MMIRRLVFSVLVVLASTVLVAQQEPRNTHSRSIQTGGSGPRRLAVDVALLADSAPFRVTGGGTHVLATGGLKDLRLVDAAGQPVPYILVHEPVDPAWLEGRLLPVASTKTTSGFEVDFQAAKPIDRVRLTGLPTPFLKRVRLEGSGDRARWTLLQGEGTLFDLPEERISNTELSFTPGIYRYVRVTWNDANSGRIPLPRTVAGRETARVVPPLPSADVTFDRRPAEPGRSRYRLRLPAPSLPVVAVQLDVGNTHVHRRAVVSESRFSGIEAGPAVLGAAQLVRVLQSGVTAESLRIPVAAPSEPELDLVVEDGDNPPLDLRGVRLVFAELPWIYFESTSPTLVARFGDRSATPPRYDLESARASIDLARVPEAHWDDVTTAGPAALVEETPPASLAGAQVDGEFRHVRDVTVPAKGGLVALSLDPALLSHSRGPAARFADVRILTGDNKQVPYLIERRDEPTSVDLALHGEPASSIPLPAAGGGSRSIYRMTLPQPKLPVSVLTVETSARVFNRSVQLGIARAADRGHRERWFDVLAAKTWVHAGEQEVGQPLSLALPSVDQTDLWLVVDEGDNAPLPLTSARLLLPSYRLRFFAPAKVGLRLAYGRDDLEAPRYDLALLAARVMGAAPVEVSAAPEPASTGKTRFVSPLWFGILLGVSALVLLGIIVRLARRA